jgi:hypothetical protein
MRVYDTLNHNDFNKGKQDVDEFQAVPFEMKLNGKDEYLQIRSLQPGFYSNLFN